jgi:hypothetical protein
MPNLSVNSFIANFQGGGARPNLYEVILTFPSLVSNPFATLKASYTCKAATIPSSNMAAIDVPYMGRAVKVAGDKTFDDWTVTIINDTDFAVRDAFERWLDRINGHESNVAAFGWGNPSNYYANAVVRQMGREGQYLKEYYVEGIFPTQVGEIQLGYDQNDQIEEFQVTFAVNYWSSYTTS